MLPPILVKLSILDEISMEGLTRKLRLMPRVSDGSAENKALSYPLSKVTGIRSNICLLFK